MSKSILAVDIGTSSVRSIIFNLDGKAEAMHQELLSVDMPHPGWQEQDPDEIFAKTVRAIKCCLEKMQISRDQLAGISFSSQMYSIFPVDSSGTPLMKSIIWADSRSDKQAEFLKLHFGKRYFYETTACPIDSIYPFSKILWVKETHPDIFQQAERFISIKEYILQKLTGDYYADYSCASATGMFDVANHRWDERALHALGITPEKLAVPLNVTTCLKLKNPYLAGELGLPAGFPVVIGAGDGPLANLGSGATCPGDINIDLGTSGAARTIVDKPVLDPDSRLWCYCLTENKWALGGILNNVGNLYKWFAEKVAFFGQESTEEHLTILNSYAEKSQPGANGLYFLPFLWKARSPYWDSDFRGSVFGLNPSHNIQDIARGMIEGVAFNLRSIIQAIRENTNGISRIVFTGGLAKAEIWGHIIADVLGERLTLSVTREGSGGGAAILGFFALGLTDRLEFNTTNNCLRIYEPNISHPKQYSNLFENYKKICATVKELNVKLT